MNLTPDELVYAKLITLFDASVVGPGPLVYHSTGGDPTPPYVTYRRTNTEYTRDIMGNVSMSLVSYDLEVSSMFFNQADADLSSLDNWTSGSWFFNLSDQGVSNDQFGLTYSLTAASAF